MSSVFFRKSLDTDIRYIKDSKKSFEKGSGGILKEMLLKNSENPKIGCAFEFVTVDKKHI